MSFRALELLCLPQDKQCLLLDIGCGSGLSGEILDEEGHIWIGLDIAPAMLSKSPSIHSDEYLLIDDTSRCCT
jgi:18S rRNA (guanine1575-N7)-methyltransferase